MHCYWVMQHIFGWVKRNEQKRLSGCDVFAVYYHEKLLLLNPLDFYCVCSVKNIACGMMKSFVKTTAHVFCMFERWHYGMMTMVANSWVLRNSFLKNCSRSVYVGFFFTDKLLVFLPTSYKLALWAYIVINPTFNSSVIVGIVLTKTSK